MEAQKSIVIVGPGEHFGYALAQRFGAEGFHIVLLARKTGPLEALQKQLTDEGVSCECVVADVISEKEVAEIFTAREPLSIAGLIFNVKASPKGNGVILSPTQLTEALSANVSGVLIALQTMLPYFAVGASVMLTGGGYKDKPDPEKLALSVSKGALHTLFLSLIEPLGARGLKIGTVIIDGVVRAEGPIYPEQVSQAFLDVFQGENGKEVRVSSPA